MAEPGRRSGRPQYNVLTTGMSDTDTNALAREILSAYDTGSSIPLPPSARSPELDLNSAYAVEAEFARLRKQSGARTAGLKVGFANKAMWRALKLETLLWAHMYDDTVHQATGELALPYYRSPRIEPEIVFRLKQPPASGMDAAAVLECVKWLAIGFEIIDCPYPDWQFKPADFVAAFGLHLALVIGQPLHLEPAMIQELVSLLAAFKVRVSKDGELVEEGSGRNSLRSPALCLAELASAVLRQPGAEPLVAGDLVSSGTLTSGHPISRGETWRVEVDGLPLSALTLRLT
jgi:2-keto-4-pentenoate hydratase